jgi:hypothetical protein
MLTMSPETNHKNIPPPRPLLHIPSLLLPNPHITRMGLRIRRRLHTNTTYNNGFYIWTLPSPLPRHSNIILLSRRTLTRTRKLHITRSPARTVQLERSRRRQRRAGIWILLGRCYKSICASLGVSVCGAVFVYAADWDGSLVSERFDLSDVVTTNSNQAI